MLTNDELKRLNELEAKPFGSLSPSEAAELAYLQNKQSGGRAGFVGRDRTMPEESDKNSDREIGRDKKMPE